MGKPAALLTINLLFLALGVSRGEAQSLSIGGRAGVGVAGAIFEDDFSDGRVDGIFAFQIGAMASRHLTRGLSFRVEALLSQKGWDEQSTGGGRRMRYIDLPLLVGIHAPWKVSPHVVLGPALSFEVGCAITGVPEVGRVGCGDPQLEWDRPKFLVAGYGGLGVSFPFSRGRAYVDIRVNLALTDVNREPLPRGRVSTGSAILSLGYTVPLGGD